jgi:HK97 family phage prohead protease
MENTKDYIKGLNDKAERRYFTRPLAFAEVETNGAKSVDENVIEGYAAVFNSDSEDFGSFVERIAPGAFSERLKDDTVALFNHSMNQVLGRNGVNLTLSEDEVGLKYRCVLPDTTFARDMRTLVKDGIINKSSFAFTVREETWTHPEDRNKPSIRTIKKVEYLYDVSPVTTPAYKDTSVASRSFEQFKKTEQTQLKTKEALGQRAIRINRYKQIFTKHN